MQETAAHVYDMIEAARAAYWLNRENHLGGSPGSARRYNSAANYLKSLLCRWNVQKPDAYDARGR